MRSFTGALVSCVLVVYLAANIRPTEAVISKFDDLFTSYSPMTDTSCGRCTRRYHSDQDVWSTSGASCGCRFSPLQCKKKVWYPPSNYELTFTSVDTSGLPVLYPKVGPDSTIEEDAKFNIYKPGSDYYLERKGETRTVKDIFDVHDFDNFNSAGTAVSGNPNGKTKLADADQFCHADNKNNNGVDYKNAQEKCRVMCPFLCTKNTGSGVDYECPFNYDVCLEAEVRIKLGVLSRTRDGATDSKPYVCEWVPFGADGIDAEAIDDQAFWDSRKPFQIKQYCGYMCKNECVFSLMYKKSDYKYLCTI